VGEDQTIHPYFDDVEQDTWLSAEVVMTTPAAVAFRVLPPATWSGELSTRVSNHFRLMGLSTLYSSHAAQELVNIRHLLEGMYQASGRDAVRDHLVARTASIMAVRRNSWQLATYRALSESDWYCDGGFAAA
jgi:hypothetical protein